MLTKFKRTFSHIAVSGITLFATTASFAETVSLSMQDLIQTALEYNPQIEVALHQFDQTKGGITQARSVYLPRLDAGVGYSRYHINGLEPVEEDNVGSAYLKATQLIFDFGRATGLINSSEYLSDAAKSNLIQFIHDIIYQVKQNYYSVLEKEKLIEVAEQAVQTYEQHLLRAQKYYEAGVRTRIDVTNAEVELSNAKIDLLRAESNLKTAKVKLEQILGTIPNSGDYDLLTNDPALDMLASSKPPLESPLNYYLQTAAENRPVLSRMASLIQSSESDLTRVRGNYWPSIGLAGETDVYETDLPSLYDQWYVGINLSWEFFSGFETDGQVAEAKSKVRELEATLRELQLSITQDVTDSYLRADENREAVDLADQTLKLAKENLDLAEGRYKAGLNDMIEFNDAQLTYTRSQSNLVATYYSYLTTIAKTERASGIMPELSNERLEKILASSEND